MGRDALVVGINRYTDESLPDLRAPSEDAEAIAQILERDGDFRVTRLPGVKDKENQAVRVGKKTRVPLADLEDAIVQLFKPEGKPPATALLYFSGHGLRKNRGISEGFLATSDANPDGGNWGLRLQWLRRLLQESDVQEQIIILDCCYAGEVVNVAEAYPEDRGKARNRCFIAASRAFEIAYETIDGLHSVLTAALLQGLEPQADRSVTNYTLIDSLDRFSHNFPQRPIFANSGEVINLTGLSQVVKKFKPASTTAICPYKGLEYFDCTEADARFFYGRTALTDQLLEKVRSGNFLAVLGASGSGKSSVVRAGLLYQLMLGWRLSGSEAWHIRIFRPGKCPLKSLAQAFVGSPVGDETNPREKRSYTQIATEMAQTEDLLSGGADGLRQLVQAASTPRVVLVVDQFEEAFTQRGNTEKREQFFACLLGALAQVGEKLCLVLAMRADFFGKCAEREYGGLARAIQENLVTVTPMNREELTAAIVQPAEQVGVAVEPELVERAIEDVEGSPGSLPLLQYALRELWQLRSPLAPLTKGGNSTSLTKGENSASLTKGENSASLTKRGNSASLTKRENPASPFLRGIEGDLLTLAAYTRLGGVKGTLEKRATAVYKALSEEKQKVAKHIFLALTQLGEGTEDTRRPVRKSELVTSRHPEEMVDAVVQKLADERLIVTRKADRKRGSGAIVDVAHEALIRSWRQLRQWLDESRETLRQTRKIEQAAAEWEERRKAKDYLLQGRRLREARELQQDIALSRLAEGFIDRSIRQRRIDWLKIAGVVAIPIVAVVAVVEPSLRQGRIDGNLDVLKSGKGTVREMEYLTIGCNVQFRNSLPLRLADLLFGHCVPLGDYKLENIYLREANLQGAILVEAKFKGSNLQGANLQGAILRAADLGDANLQGANLQGTQLQGAILVEAKFQGANLQGANLQGAELQVAKLQGANLQRANLSGAELQAANFQGAELQTANLQGANLWIASLQGANLSGANLSGANLSGAKDFDKVDNLTPAQVKSACYWQEAKFDPEFQAELNQSPDPETEVDCSRWE